VQWYILFIIIMELLNGISTVPRHKPKECRVGGCGVWAFSIIAEGRGERVKCKGKIVCRILNILLTFLKRREKYLATEVGSWIKRLNFIENCCTHDVFRPLARNRIGKIELPLLLKEFTPYFEVCLLTEIACVVDTRVVQTEDITT